MKEGQENVLQAYIAPAGVHDRQEGCCQLCPDKEHDIIFDKEPDIIYIAM